MDRPRRGFPRLQHICMLLLLLGSALLPQGGNAHTAAPVDQARPAIGSVQDLVLDDAGNGWALADSADAAKSDMHLLLRIENGSWRVAADSTTQPALLPAGLGDLHMAITAR